MLSMTSFPSGLQRHTHSWRLTLHSSHRHEGQNDQVSHILHLLEKLTEFFTNLLNGYWFFGTEIYNVILEINCHLTSVFTSNVTENPCISCLHFPSFQSCYKLFFRLVQLNCCNIAVFCKHISLGGLVKRACSQNI